MSISPPSMSAANAPDETLRDAHKALTRERIRNAVKDLLLTSTANAVTMERIAIAAGVSRPTVYVHFKDKDEIIRDIVAIYGQRVVAVNKSIAGPNPSIPEIREWLERKVAFYKVERVSLSLLYQAGHADAAGRSHVAHEMMTQAMMSLAAALPAFRAAIEPGAHQPHARVRGEMLIRQVTAACDLCAREGMTQANEAALDITAETFRSVLDRFEALKIGSGKLEEQPEHRSSD